MTQDSDVLCGRLCAGTRQGLKNPHKPQLEAVIHSFAVHLSFCLLRSKFPSFQAALSSPLTSSEAQKSIEHNTQHTAHNTTRHRTVLYS
mmetsp:Transcript_36551/g.94913  ORF Transcript_36551/g.94913 Transcript_36551/m.94913 type:complete len:89 (+) Transcript_36551:479-745(+)